MDKLFYRKTLSYLIVMYKKIFKHRNNYNIYFYLNFTFCLFQIKLQIRADYIIETINYIFFSLVLNYILFTDL